MKTGARNVNSPPYSPKPRLTDSGLSTFRTLRDGFPVQEFPANSEQFMERSTLPDYPPVISMATSPRTLLRVKLDSRTQQHLRRSILLPSGLNQGISPLPNCGESESRGQLC